VYNKSVDKTATAAAAVVNVVRVEEDQEIRSDLIAMIIVDYMYLVL